MNAVTILAVIAEFSEVLSKVRIVGQTHTSFSGSDDFSRMKTQASNLTEGSAWLEVYFASQAARGIDD
jgi:hypothetical protein